MGTTSIADAATLVRSQAPAAAADERTRALRRSQSHTTRTSRHGRCSVHRPGGPDRLPRSGRARSDRPGADRTARRGGGRRCLDPGHRLGAGPRHTGIDRRDGLGAREARRTPGVAAAPRRGESAPRPRPQPRVRRADPAAGTRTERRVRLGGQRGQRHPSTRCVGCRTVVTGTDSADRLVRCRGPVRLVDGPHRGLGLRPLCRARFDDRHRNGRRRRPPGERQPGP